MASTPISINGLLSNVSLSLLGSSDPLSAVSIGGPLIDPVSASIMLTNGSMPTSALGTLSGLGLVAGSTPGSYTLSAASPALLTTALKALQFTPAAGATVAPMLTLTVTDPMTQSTASSVIGAVLPTVTDATTQLTSVVGTTLTPLSGLTIADPSAIAASANVTLTVNGVASNADGTLSGTGVSSLGNGLYRVNAPTLAGLNANLDNLQFTPVAAAPGASTMVELDTSIVSAAGTVVVPRVSLNVDTPSVPVLSGLASSIATGASSVSPFADVDLTGIDPRNPTALRIITSDDGVPGDANGVLSGTGLTETSAGSGTYTLNLLSSGDPTAALDGLTFTPTPSSNGTPTSTTVTLQAVSAVGTETLGITSIDVFAAAPSITGLPAAESANNGASIKPFGSVSVSDASAGASDSATIVLSAGGVGSLSTGSLPANVLTSVGQGTYTLAATSPATLTSELDQVVFTPSSSPGTTTISLDVTNAARISATASTTLSTTPMPAPASPVISGLSAQESGMGSATVDPFGSVSISDTSPNAADSATITLDANGSPSDSNGVLTGSWLVETSPGIYSLSATTPATLSSELNELSFKPEAPDGGTTTITLAVTNAGGASVTGTTTLAYQPAAPVVTAAPMIAGIASGESTTGSATINPFGSATVSDATTNAADSATITLDVNNAPSDANGALSGAGLTETSPGVYTLAATSPAALTAELQSLVFTPVAGTAATSTSIALDVANQAGLQATATTNLSDTPATAPSNPGTTAAPMIAGIASGESTTGSATINPFGSATVSDATTNAADSATITLDVNNAPSDANGALSGAGLTETSPGVYTLAATSPAALTAELQSLVFTPVAGTAATSTSIALDVANQAGLQATATTNLSDTPATAPSNPGTTAAPMIAGIASGESTTGSATINPFGSATVSDATTNAADSATITLDVNNAPSDANGALSGAGLTETSPGVYTLAATSPAALTAELQSLVFTPVAGAAATSTSIALDVANQAGLQATATTNLSDTPATAPSNPGTTAAPMIAGIASGESTTGSATINPFGSATVSDATTNAADSATITLDVNNAPSDANGALSGAGLTETSPGVYTLAATSPAALTAELQSLVFNCRHQHQHRPRRRQPGRPAGHGHHQPERHPRHRAQHPGTTAAPMIAGIASGESTTGSATINPSATVSDATTNAADSATITLDVNNAPSDANGALSGAGLTETSPGVYTLAATSPAALTAELQSLVFTPVAGAAATSTSIALDVANQAGLQATATTNLSDTPATAPSNPGTTAAPMIAGIASGESTTGSATINPFGSATVSDATTNAADSATITLDVNNAPSDANGALSGAGLTETSPGVYTLAATSPAALTAELQSLVFTPVAGAAATSTSIALDVANQAGLQATATTNLSDTPPPRPAIPARRPRR